MWGGDDQYLGTRPILSTSRTRLTEVKVVDPVVIVRDQHEMEWGPRERDYTCMRLKDSWMYICAATMARKYTVASVTKVRINAENLRVLLLRYIYQTTTRNADRSTPCEQTIPEPLTNECG